MTTLHGECGSLKPTSLVTLLAVLAMASGVSQAATIIKANNTNNLNSGLSWIGGVAPGAADTAVWEGTVTNDQTLTPGADLSWQGMQVNFTRNLNLTINAGNTLTLGSGGLIAGIVTNKNLTLKLPLAMADDQAWTIASHGTGALIIDTTAGLNTAGHTLTFNGPEISQFKSPITGGGNLVVSAGTLKLTGTGATATASAILVDGATLAYDTATSGAGAAPRASSVELKAGSFTIGGYTNDTVESVSNALTIGAGVSTVSITPNTNRNARLYVGSLVRGTDHGTVTFQGTGLGTIPLATPTTNCVNIVFGTAPALSGAGGGKDTTTNSILVGAIGDTTTAGNGYGLTGGLLTYDSACGLRLLSYATEYSPTLVDGQDGFTNVFVTNNSMAAYSTNISLPTSVNSLSIRAVTNNCGITLAGFGKLTVRSGMIFAASLCATSGPAERVTVTNLTIDLNGGEGCFVFSTKNVSSSGISGGYVELVDSVITNDNGAGVTFSGSGMLRFGGTTTNAYSGTTTLNAGNLHLNKSAPNASIPGNLVINAGNVIDSGNQIADTADITINGGAFQQRLSLNTGSGASETYRDLTLNNGTCNSGQSGTSSGISGLRNATVNGGTWNVTKGHLATVADSVTVSGGVVNISGSTDTTRGGWLQVTNTFTIVNRTTGAYTPITIGNASSNAAAGRLALMGTFRFLGNAFNTNTVAITTNTVGVDLSMGMIALNGTRTFDIADGAAPIDLAISATITSNGATAGGFVKTGNGTLSLSGANRYTGPTIISNGTVVVDGCTVSRVTICSNATLTGAGSIVTTNGAALTVNRGGLLSPGGPGVVGTFSITGDVYFADGAQWQLDAGDSGADLLAASGNVTQETSPLLVTPTISGSLSEWKVMTASGIVADFKTGILGWVYEKRANATELWLVRGANGCLFTIQ